MPTREGLSGPHISAAFLCEKVLKEQDGVPSFIRVVERFTVPKFSLPPGVQLPPGMPPPIVQFHLVVMLKAGDLGGGKFAMRLALMKPDGSQASSQSVDVFFNGGDENGVAAILPIAIPSPEEGLHWFDVYFEERLLTRIPMRVLFQQIQMSPFAPM
jgi:hypothetical protein